MITIDDQPRFVSMDALFALECLRTSHGSIPKKLGTEEAMLYPIHTCSTRIDQRHQESKRA